MEKALDQLDNAFIRVETKRRKQMSEEHFEQRLKTIEEKKEDQNKEVVFVKKLKIETDSIMTFT